MTYTASVMRKTGRRGDSAFIDGPNGGDDQTISNKLTHIPPVENNVSYYRGTFALLGDAIEAVKRDFPQARVSFGTIDDRHLLDGVSETAA